MFNPPPRTKQPTEARQAGLVAAALALAAQRSPADISTTDLARAVGIAQGAVFRHFPSKDAIWLTVLAWVAGVPDARARGRALELLAPLDSERALAVVRTLHRMAREAQTAIIVVTHDEKIIRTFKRIHHIRDGQTHEEAGQGVAVE